MSQSGDISVASAAPVLVVGICVRPSSANHVARRAMQYSDSHTHTYTATRVTKASPSFILVCIASRLVYLLVHSYDRPAAAAAAAMDLRVRGEVGAGALETPDQCETIFQHRMDHESFPRACMRFVHGAYHDM